MFIGMTKGLFYIIGPIATVIVGSEGHCVWAFILAFAIGNSFQCDLRKLIETGTV